MCIRDSHLAPAALIASAWRSVSPASHTTGAAVCAQMCIRDRLCLLLGQAVKGEALAVSKLSHQTERRENLLCVIHGVPSGGSVC